MQTIKSLWGKVRLPLFIIILCLGSIGWTTFYFLFPPMYQESQQVWNDHLQRQLNKESGIGESVEAQEEQKTESFVPISEDAEQYDSARGGGQPPAPVHEILPKIYQLESSGGKNDGCKSKGLVNGYGYSQSTFSWRCYKTKEEVEKEVADWFDRNLETYSLAQAVCRYNTGTPSESCPYWEKFKSL